MRYVLFLLFSILLAANEYFKDLNFSLAPGLSVKNAILYAVFLGIAIEAAVTRNRRIELMPVIVPYGLFVIYGTVSWIFVLTMASYPAYGPITTMISLKSHHIDHFMIFLVFFYGVLTIKDSMWLLRAILWVVIGFNFITMVDAWNIPNLGLVRATGDGRVGGPLAEANQYGALLALLIPALVVTYRTDTGKSRLCSGAGVAFTLLAFIAAASRGAMVGIVIGGIVGAFYLRRYISMRVVLRAAFAAALMSVLGILILIAFGYGDLLYERFIFRSADSNLDSVSSIRTVIWGRALGDMLDNPMSMITGFGWNVYEKSNRYSYGTHSTYLNLFYNLGIIGVTLFLVIAANALSIARRALRRAAMPMYLHLQAFVFGLLALLISAFFVDLPFTKTYVWAYTGIMMRIAIECQRPQQAGTNVTATAQSLRRQ